MIAFAALMERLSCTTAPAARRVLLHRYFTTIPDPTRGYALAALTGVRLFPAMGPSAIRALALTRTDPVLLTAARGFVGDLTETIALMWPAARSNAAPPDLAAVIAGLNGATKAEVPALVAGWLDASEPRVRVALLKLIARGGQAPVTDEEIWDVLGAMTGTSPAAIETAWRGAAPPYDGLFASARADTVPIPPPEAGRVVRVMLLYAEPNAYTIGVWKGDHLVPIGQATADDADAAFLAQWARSHTINRFGVVREVEKTMVLSVSFQSIRPAPRRKAGIALRGARVVMVHGDGAVADSLDALSA